jgi:hypothetical protein
MTSHWLKVKAPRMTKARRNAGADFIMVRILWFEYTAFTRLRKGIKKPRPRGERGSINAFRRGITFS